MAKQIFFNLIDPVNGVLQQGSLDPAGLSGTYANLLVPSVPYQMARISNYTDSYVDVSMDDGTTTHWTIPPGGVEEFWAPVGKQLPITNVIKARDGSFAGLPAPASGKIFAIAMILMLLLTFCRESYAQPGAQPVKAVPYDSSLNEKATLSNPLRVDPVGTTAQPVTQSGSWVNACTQSGSWTNACTQSGGWTVTANAGTNLNTSALALESGGNLATIAGKDFATQTTLSALNAKVTAVNTGAVVVSSSALPAGASTAAKQPALGTAGTASTDVITVQGIASMTALKVDGSAVTQPISGTVAISGTVPVSGTVAATQSGTWILGANSGVDIGDVTINNAGGAAAVNIQDGGNSITIDGSVTATLSGAVDTELPATAALADNTANPTITSTGTFFHYYDGSTWDRARGDSTDGLLVNLGVNNDVTLGAALPAGTNNIGDVDVLSLPTLNVNNVSGTVSLPTGAATAANQSSEITALQLIDDVVHSGDAALSKYATIGAVLDDTATGTVTENQAQALRMSTRRALLVEGVASGTAMAVSVASLPLPSGAATEATLSTLNSKVTAVDTGNVTIAALPNEGQQTMANSISVTVASNQSAVPVSVSSLPLPSGAATLAEQQTQTTSLQLLDDAVATTASAITTKGIAASGTDGTNARVLKTDTGGELQIDVLTVPSITIGAAIPAGNNNIGDVDVASIAAGNNNIGDVDVASLPSVTIGTFPDNEPINIAQMNGVAVTMGNGASGTGVQRVTIANDSTGTVAATQSGTWNITNVSGTVSLPTGAATSANQSTEITSLQLLDDAVATTASAITTKGIAASGTDGTNARVLKTDTGGELQIDVLTVPSVTIGTFPDNEPINVAQMNGVAVTMGNGVAGTGVQRVAIASDNTAFTVNAAQSGTWNVTNISGTVSLPTGASTLAEQQTQTTALQLIDDVVIADDAAFTPATTKVAMSGFEFDDTTPDSVNEGDAGAARMSANRNIYTTLRDAAGNERGLNIDANNRMSATVLGTTAVGVAVPNPVVIGFSDFATGATTIPDTIDFGGITYPLMLLPDPDLNFMDYTAAGELRVHSHSTDNTEANARYAKVDSNSNVMVVGSIAHDAADSGNPVKVGYKVTSANALPTAATNADRVDAFGDEYGRLQTRNNVAGTPTSTNCTASGNTTLITPSSGKKLRVKFIHLVNNTATTVKVGLRCAAAGTIRFTGDVFPDGGTRIMNLLNAYWECATDEALIANLSGAGDVDVSVLTEEF